jgi:hypothetical protein
MTITIGWINFISNRPDVVGVAVFMNIYSGQPLIKNIYSGQPLIKIIMEKDKRGEL